jgi:hypothetical protein
MTYPCDAYGQHQADMQSSAIHRESPHFSQVIFRPFRAYAKFIARVKKEKTRHVSSHRVGAEASVVQFYQGPEIVMQSGVHPGFAPADARLHTAIFSAR